MNREWTTEDELRYENRQLRAALRELVEVKYIKDVSGKTDEYKARQPAAWAEAQRIVSTPY